MAFLDYVNVVTPKMLGIYVKSFEYNDPLHKRIYNNNARNEITGTDLRIRRVKASGLNVTEISAANIQTPVAITDHLEVMVADWGMMAGSISFATYDLDRMGSAEKQKYVEQVTKAVTQADMIQTAKRMYLGTPDLAPYNMLGSLNGGNTSGTKTGFTRGALMFETVATQTGGSYPYLSSNRVKTGTADENSWYNQYLAHSGIDVDFLDVEQQLKNIADSYGGADDEEGIDLALMSISDHMKLGNAVRNQPGSGGVSAVHYTVDDLEKGRTHKQVFVVNGIHHYSNRLMESTIGGGTTATIGKDQAVYLLNSRTWESWVNKNKDFAMPGGFVDRTNTTGTLALVAVWQRQKQVPVCTELLRNACTSKA